MTPYEYTGYLKPQLPIILQMLRDGMDPAEVAQKISPHVSHYYEPTAMISYIAKRYGLFPKIKTNHGMAERNAEMVKLHDQGMIYTDIAKKFGISRARVAAIVMQAHSKAAREKRIEAERQLVTNVDDMTLDMVPMTVRCLNALRYDYKTVGDLKKATDRELLDQPNFGRRSLADLKECLNRLEEEMLHSLGERG